jgi:hypothetical protein
MCSDPLSVLHQVPECHKHHPLMDSTFLWSQGLIKKQVRGRGKGSLGPQRPSGGGGNFTTETECLTVEAPLG